ncbi:hypothetical protein T484DRAFT_1988041 [Baffinella frigidus]|nr:hypothetical protein T484DRAFT_1988041 [Cryptophyta sp. CCMP2293]
MQAAQPAPTTWRLLPAAPSPKKEGGNWFDNATSFVSAIVEEGSKTVVDSAEAMWSTSPGTPVDRSIFRCKSDGSGAPSASSRDIGTPRSCLRSPSMPGWHDHASHASSSAPFPRASSSSSASGHSTPESKHRVHFSPSSSISFSPFSSPSSLRTSSQSTLPSQPPAPEAPCITLTARCKNLKRAPLPPQPPRASSSLPPNASNSSRPPAGQSSSPIVANASRVRDR